MLQPKDTQWLNGYKNKKHTYDKTYDYIRLISESEMHTVKVSEWKNVFHANGNQKRARAALLTSDKTGFKIKETKKDTTL